MYYKIFNYSPRLTSSVCTIITNIEPIYVHRMTSFIMDEDICRFYIMLWNDASRPLTINFTSQTAHVCAQFDVSRLL